MRIVETSLQNFLNANTHIGICDFVFFSSTEASSGDPVSLGLHSSVGTISIEVISGNTGLEETRNYYGDGSLISISSVKQTSDLTVQSTEISVNADFSAADNFFRSIDSGNTKIEIHRGFYDMANFEFQGKPILRFFGYLNSLDYEHDGLDSEESISISAVSVTRDLAIKSILKKNHEYQSLRSNDAFRKYTDSTQDWIIKWGKK